MGSIAAMQAQRKGARGNHTERVVFRLTPGELAELDSVRGEGTRSAFIREAIAREAGRRATAGGPAAGRRGMSGVPAGYDPAQARG